MKKLGMFLMAGVFAFGVALPAWAMEFNFYGQANLYSGYYWSSDEEFLFAETVEEKHEEFQLQFGNLYYGRIGALVQVTETVSGGAFPFFRSCDKKRKMRIRHLF